MVEEVVGSLQRQQHRALVLGALRADGALPKAELARRLGVSITAVSEIVGGFEAEGLVEVVGTGESSGGRRPLLYDLRRDRLRAVGVNVDLDCISAVIADLSGEVQAESALPYDRADGREAFTNTLDKVLDEVLAAACDAGCLAGIGIALPASIRRSGKGAFVPPDPAHWGVVNLHQVVGERFHLPVVIENRAQAVAVGEYLFGAGQGWSNLLCLIIGAGIGAGILRNGRLITGGDSGAGSVGRMTLNIPASDGSGPQRRVHTLIGARGIETSAADRLRKAGCPVLAGVPADQVDVDLVIDQALAGDASMVDVLADVGRTLGAAVAVTLCVTDSDLVLLCGPTMRAGELIVGPLKATLRDRTPFALPEIRLGRLGPRAGTLGAAALVLTDLVSEIKEPTVRALRVRKQGRRDRHGIDVR